MRCTLVQHLVLRKPCTHEALFQHRERAETFFCGILVVRPLRRALRPRTTDRLLPGFDHPPVCEKKGLV